MTAERWFWDRKFSLSSINFNLCVAISKLQTSRSDTSSESKQKSVFSSFSLSITSRKSEKRRSTIWDDIPRHFVLCNELVQPLHTQRFGPKIATEQLEKRKRFNNNKKILDGTEWNRFRDESSAYLLAKQNSLQCIPHKCCAHSFGEYI